MRTMRLIGQAGTSLSFWPWAAGLGLGLVAMVLREVAVPMLGDAVPWLFAFPAVAVAARYVGVAPALLTAMTCGLWIMMSGSDPDTPGPVLLMQTGLFLSAAFFVAFVSHGNARRTPRPAPPGSRALPRTPLINWLTASLYGAVLLPVVFGVAAGWYNYNRAIDLSRNQVEQGARLAEAVLADALRVNREIFARLEEVVAGQNDAALIAQGDALHERLREMAIGHRQIENISIIGANGRPVAINSTRRIPENLTVEDREYFRMYRSGRQGILVTEVLVARPGNQPIFNITMRRNLPDGSFGGLYIVSMRPEFFSGFYRNMSHQTEGLVVTLLRSDGALISRWPPLPQDKTGSPGSEAARRMQGVWRTQKIGMVTMQSPFDGTRRLLAFRQVGDWPLYVTAGLSYDKVLADWYRIMATLLAFIVPAMLGLSYVSWVALRRSRREQLVQLELQDESQRRTKAEQALLHAQKIEALGQLTGGVAHDFNNLLMVISNNAHLHRFLVPQAAESSQLAAIDRAVQGGAKLTRQLLSFSRRQTVHPEVIELQAHIPALLDLVRTSLGSGVSLELQVDENTPAVKLDVGEFELALINLALNARDAMPDGGRLTISAGEAAAGEVPDKPGQRFVAVRVMDTGTGIAPENVERVFEPFFTTKPPGKGTGLGLSQVYGFCIQAGGSARVESNLRVGTTVSMYFPASEAPAQPAAETPTPALRRLAGHILLVEDNPDIADTTTRLLEGVGVTVRHVTSADEAFQLLTGSEPERFEAVLSDIFMAGSYSGLDLALIARRRYPGLPVILMTGYAAEEQRAVDAGFPVLRKPFAPDVLVRALERALGAGPVSTASGE